MAEDVSGTPEPESEPESTEPAPQLPATDTVVDAEPARPVGGVAVQSRADRARHSAYRFRFVLFYFGLAIVAGSAVGAFAVVLSRPPAPAKAAWSSWRPDGRSASARVLQIADHVPKGYRLGNGQALVLAHASSPSVTSTSEGQQIELPIVQITLLPALDTVDASTSLQISFCGLGKTCPIALSPSVATLLRRETLELALFTFKYVDRVQSITFLMPPTTPQTAIFLQRRDVTKELSEPLARSLTETPPKPDAIPASELRIIDRVTHPRLYHFDVRQEPGGHVVEVLTPFTLAS